MARIPPPLSHAPGPQKRLASCMVSTRDLELVGRTEESEVIARLLEHPRGRSGVLLAGTGGVGKTRLLEEVVRSFRDRVHVVRLDVAAGSDHGLRQLAGFGRSPVPAQRGRGPALVVDDAHLLSPAAADLVLGLARRRQGTLLVTVNPDARPPAGVTALWKDDHLARLDIGPLDVEATRRLASALLDHRLSHESTVRLAHLSHGNPLLLRELVRAALDQGLLTDEGGWWVLGEGIPTSAALSDLCSSRIAGLTPECRHALELIALAEPVPIDVLQYATAYHDLVALETQGFIDACTADGGDLSGTGSATGTGPATGSAPEAGAGDVIHLRLTHPLVGHVVRQEIRHLRHRRLLRRLVEGYAKAGRTTREDSLRAARWTLEAGQPVPEADLLAAARCAYQHHDLRTAGFLSHGAWEQHRSVEAAVLHATMLISLAEFDSAFDVLDAALAAFPQEKERLTTTRVRGYVLQGRLDAAEEAVRELDNPESRLYRGMICYFRGHFDHALAVFEPFLKQDDESYIEAAVFVMAALCHTGRPLDALALHTAVGTWSSQRQEFFDRHESSMAEMHAAALHYAGRIDEAAEVLNKEYETALARQQVRVDSRRGMALGFVLLEAGRPRRALSFFDPNASHHVGWKQWQDKAAVHRVLAATSLPDYPHMKEAEEELPPAYESNFRNAALIAHAWVAARRADSEAAAALLTSAAETARANGGHADVAAAVHEMGRLGLATAAQRFWDTPVQGAFLQARLDYTRAVATKDGRRLRAAAAVFTEAGAELFAAEAHAELSRLSRRAGDERGATAAAARAGELAARCGGVLTPPLHALDEIEPLTSREREIAFLAARGMSDKDIAERLTLSVRTVGNHLYRIYRKLGADGRQNLRARIDDRDLGP